MRSIILLWLISFAPPAIHAQPYRHKSEAEIARLTPAQRVEEYAEEDVRHKYDLDDDHAELIEKYIWRDGLAALPRIIEIMDEYDPTRFREGQGSRGERFDAVRMLLGDLDTHVVRLRGSEEGRRALQALERVIGRMRAAGYGQKDQHEWERHGRFGLAVMNLKEAKGVGAADKAISNTLRLEYKALLSDEELFALSDFLILSDATYPSWSELDFIKDFTKINEAGNPARIYIMKKPERFYEVYLEFKKTTR
jgi:hypothetical protein